MKFMFRKKPTGNYIMIHALQIMTSLIIYVYNGRKNHFEKIVINDVSLYGIFPVIYF